MFRSPRALRRWLIVSGTALATAIALVSPMTSSVAATPSATSSPGDLSLVSTTSHPGHGWDSAQLWRDNDPSWPAARYLPDGRQDQTGEVATLFGSARPPGSQFLLYRAPGWQTNTGPAVLLVAGVDDNVDRAYADPGADGSGTCGVSSCPSTGLMQQLANAGYRVFAVNFANMQGDNYEWAQTIGDALQRVRDETGAASADLLAWSKGAFAARMYVAGVRPSWGRDYQHDVSKLVLIGGPNGGLDYVFGHGATSNMAIYPECGGAVNSPSPSQSYMCYFRMYAEPDLSVNGSYYTGQRQMLARWDTPYGVDTTQQDWYTTYYGGTGYVSTSKGIQYAIDHGSLVEELQQSPTPADVPTYLLCGGAPTIPDFYNETRGPSDGVVFEASCLDGAGIGDLAGTRLIASDNHLMLGWEPTAADTVEGWLS
ncbi:esterase/lipase family protein [Flexivirga oryzae]|uniref:Lipase n=1 Tax=Flexivirga oryzae TaxID=1794944 RepID=A0A839N9B6_9MICO|nr:lipase [Flexivirga oryzae]MBB2892753.1 hypothetical protein [Flexivirga oryzae]